MAPLATSHDRSYTVIMGLRKEFDRDQQFARPHIQTDKRSAFRESATLLRYRGARGDGIMDKEYEELAELAGAKRDRVGVAFEPTHLSPYIYPLDGEHYEVEPGFGPTGLCPLCNNAQHDTLDKELIKGIDKPRAWRRMGFSEKVVFEHVVNHIGPIYAHSGRTLVDELAIRSTLDDEDKPELLARVGGAIRRTMGKVSEERAERRRDEIYKVEVVVEPGYGDLIEDEAEIPIEPSIQGRPEGARAKEWYAFDGDMQLGPLRPWGDERMANEIQKRADDSIVFYDEMLDVRRMGKRIYDEIMDGDPGCDKNGNELARNYSAAIQAARVVKDVAMDMAKLALIATKLGDEKDKVRRVSPTMQAMIDEIGIFEKAGSEATSIPCQVVDEDLGPMLDGIES